MSNTRVRACVSCVSIAWVWANADQEEQMTSKMNGKKSHSLNLGRSKQCILLFHNKTMCVLSFWRFNVLFPVLLPSIILADLSGNRSLVQWAVKVTCLGCDWFFLSSFVGCPSPYDWQQPIVSLGLNFRVRFRLLLNRDGNNNQNATKLTVNEQNKGCSSLRYIVRLSKFWDQWVLWTDLDNSDIRG